MSSRTLVSRISLLTKTYAQWELIEDTFKPKLGEVCYYIDPSTSVVRSKVGNGVNFLADLPFADAYVEEEINEKIGSVPAIYPVSTAGELEALVEDLPDNLFAIEISENQEEDNCLLWQDAIGLALDEEFDGPYITKEQEHIAGIFYVEATSENSADLRTAYGSLSFSIATDAETGIPRIYWGDWISDAFATNTSVDEKLNNILRIYDIYEIVEILEAGDPLPDNLLAIEISERDVDAFRNIYEYRNELRSCIYVTSPGYGRSIEVPSPFRVFVNTPSEPEELPSGTIKTAVGERLFHGETDEETGDSTIIYGDWTSNVFITQNEKITDVANIDSNVNVPTGAVVKAYVDANIPKVFTVTLDKNAWEENAQTVESEYFVADGYLYTVDPDTSVDMVQWTECEIYATSVSAGEMEFAYVGKTAPNKNISVVVRAEKCEVIEEPVSEIFVSQHTATLGEWDDGYPVTMNPEFDASTIEDNFENDIDSVAILELPASGENTNYAQGDIVLGYQGNELIGALISTPSRIMIQNGRATTDENLMWS